MLALDSVTYQIGDRQILNNICLSLPAGDHLLIHGASGCGKSTMTHIMAGLLQPTSGTVIWNGTDYRSVTNAQMDALRGEHFGFVFQKMHLIGHLTARQNIDIANKKGAKGDDDILRSLGITQILNQKASSLSVGESQRVALARALIHKPSVIFADEPTSALDKNNADNVMDILLTHAQKYGASLVVTSHDERIQSRFSRILDLNHA